MKLNYKSDKYEVTDPRYSSRRLSKSLKLNDNANGYVNNSCFTINDAIKSVRTMDITMANTMANSQIKDNSIEKPQLSRKMSLNVRMSDDKKNPLRRQLSFIKVLPNDIDEESLLRSAIQIIIASLCAGFGNVGAGLILDMIQTWPVFINITEMFILVPSLLGLKGNLEMTMASRLSTEANLGHMEKWSDTLKMIGGDMALVQCQATVVSFLAAFVAITVNVIQSGTFHMSNCLDICASSVFAANVACLFLGIIMVSIIVFSHKWSINPDNIATPIAASLGDVSTAGLFALIAQMIHNDTISRHGFSDTPIAAIAIIVSFIILLPLFYIIARKNSFTHELVHSGWAPVIMAMVISSGGGLFLDKAVSRYNKLPPFQPVICGVGGNLVAVSSSRISTWLFKRGKLGQLPSGVRKFSSPYNAFYDARNINTKLGLILLIMAFPAHILYAFVIWFIQRHTITLTAPLILLYVSFALLQVMILLYIGFNLVHILWSYNLNPDNYSIPLLTASGDFLGSAFLLLVFVLLEIINDPNASTMVTLVSNATDIV